VTVRDVPVGPTGAIEHLGTSMLYAFVRTAGGTGTDPGPDLSEWTQHGGTRPPGADKFVELIHWLSWGVTGVLFAGVLMAAAKMAVNVGGGGRHGHEGLTHLAWVAFACVIAGSASLIVGHLL
jgi:hypothetical protein